jgi:hypothetical protein
MDTEEINRLLFEYLERNGRVPQKGFLRKRQMTWGEMVAHAREELGKILPSTYIDNRKVQEFLGIYLRLTFSVDGWWLEREESLLLSNRWPEVIAMDGFFRQHPWF